MAGTSRQVAEAAGVSTATVSRVFSRPDQVLPHTRAAVLEAAKKLGYRPSQSARALITGRTGSLALIVPDIANPFFPPIVKAAQARALQRDLSIILADTDEDPAEEGRTVERLLPEVDGFLLCSSRMDESLIKELAASKPVVTLNRVVPGVPRVVVDAAGGMRQAVDHLAALKHRSIAYVGGPEISWSNEARLAGATEGATKNGVELTVFGPYPANFEAGRQAADTVLATDATAILAFDDLMAVGVIDRLTERAVAVPDDMSVIGFDNVLPSVTVRPRLTTVDSRCTTSGRLLVDTMQKVLHGENLSSAEQRDVPTQLIVRESTGVPRSLRERSAVAR